MPLLETSDYQTTFPFRNKHLNTIYPALLRQVPDIYDYRERITTPDQDFFDVDWIRQGSDQLLIALHGLEGSSQNQYIVWMLKYFAAQGWDGAGMNFRSCSGELNRQLRAYHMGDTGDVHELVRHILRKHKYKRIALVGFSFGGNVLLNYFGRDVDQLPPEVIGGVALSVPCYIPTSNKVINKSSNWIYLKRFLVSLNEKARIKSEQFPDAFDWEKPYPRSFDEFDERYTAPVHGFASAADYWETCSSIHHLDQIDRPVLLINAKDDPFLSPDCFPEKKAKNHSFFHLEVPTYGGHIGFVSKRKSGSYWSERRVFEFLDSLSRK